MSAVAEWSGRCKKHKMPTQHTHAPHSKRPKTWIHEYFMVSTFLHFCCYLNSPTSASIGNGVPLVSSVAIQFLDSHIIHVDLHGKLQYFAIFLMFCVSSKPSPLAPQTQHSTRMSQNSFLIHEYTMYVSLYISWIAQQPSHERPQQLRRKRNVFFFDARDYCSGGWRNNIDVCVQREKSPTNSDQK